jgi:hypothetical protein
VFYVRKKVKNVSLTASLFVKTAIQLVRVVIPQNVRNAGAGKNVQDAESGYVNSAQKNLKKSLISNMLSSATIVYLKDLKKSEKKKKKEDKEKLMKNTQIGQNKKEVNKMEIQRIIFCENLDILYFQKDRYWNIQIWEVDDIFINLIFKELDKMQENDKDVKIEYYIFSNNPAFLEIVQKTFSLTPQPLPVLNAKNHDSLILLKNGKWYVCFIWNIIQEEYAHLNKIAN